MEPALHVEAPAPLLWSARASASFFADIVMESSPSSSGRTLSHSIALSQGLYYVIGGIWPLVSIDTFQFVTGRKRDLWLVKTVGLLLTAIGAVLISAARGKRNSPEIVLLGAASAGVIGGVDVVYYRKGILRWVYLVDALAELAFIIGWLTARRRASDSGY
jgi:hypothetical protein